MLLVTFHLTAHGLFLLFSALKRLLGPPKYSRVFCAKAVAIKWRHFGFDERWNFTPEFGVALVSSCLVHVTQWRNVHLCSGFEKNGNILVLT